MLLQRLPGRRDVELDDVEIVGLHPPQALLDARHDVVAGEDVRAGWPRGAGGAPTRQPHLLAR